jgi:hypothetical protein
MSEGAVQETVKESEDGNSPPDTVKGGDSGWFQDGSIPLLSKETFA